MSALGLRRIVDWKIETTRGKLTKVLALPESGLGAPEWISVNATLSPNVDNPSKPITAVTKKRGTTKARKPAEDVATKDERARRAQARAIRGTAGGEDQTSNTEQEQQEINELRVMIEDRMRSDEASNRSDAESPGDRGLAKKADRTAPAMSAAITKKKSSNTKQAGCEMNKSSSTVRVVIVAHEQAKAESRTPIHTPVRIEGEIKPPEDDLLTTAGRPDENVNHAMPSQTDSAISVGRVIKSKHVERAKLQAVALTQDPVSALGPGARGEVSSPAIRKRMPVRSGKIVASIETHDPSSSSEWDSNSDSEYDDAEWRRLNTTRVFHNRLAKRNASPCMAKVRDDLLKCPEKIADDTETTEQDGKKLDNCILILSDTEDSAAIGRVKSENSYGYNPDMHACKSEELPQDNAYDGEPCFSGSSRQEERPLNWIAGDGSKSPTETVTALKRELQFAKAKMSTYERTLEVDGVQLQHKLTFDADVKRNRLLTNGATEHEVTEDDIKAIIAKEGARKIKRRAAVIRRRERNAQKRIAEQEAREGHQNGQPNHDTGAEGTECRRKRQWEQEEIDCARNTSSKRSRGYFGSQECREGDHRPIEGTSLANLSVGFAGGQRAGSGLRVSSPNRECLGERRGEVGDVSTVFCRGVLDAMRCAECW